MTTTKMSPADEMLTKALAVGPNAKHTPIDLALGAAREYRDLRERGDLARLSQLRANIDEWVGRRVERDGRWVARYPRIVAEQMGRPELSL